MRLIAAFVVLTLAVPATAADNPHALMKPAAPKLRAAKADPRCSPTRSYVADAGSIYHGQKLAPRKLTELPPGTIYMLIAIRYEEHDLTGVFGEDYRRYRQASAC